MVRHEAAERSFDVQCERHGYPVRTDGSCLLCERDAERAALGLTVFDPVPPHDTWPRAFKAHVLDRYLHARGVDGTPAERVQRGWESLLRSVAGADLLTHRRLGVQADESLFLIRQHRPDLWPLPAASTPAQDPAA